MDFSPETLIETVTCLPVYSWEQSCWKCGQATEVITYHILLDYNYTLGDHRRFDELLMAAFPTIRPTYSHMMGKEVIANVCSSCGALQGNFYLNETIQLRLETDTLASVKLCDLPLHLSMDDFQEKICAGRDVRDGSLHIHHIDENPANNREENLILLCNRCHKKRHTKG